MSRIISVMNQKGGIGKTTTCVNLGAALTRFSQKVLLIDFDPQANLTASMDVREEGQLTVYDWMKEECSFKEVCIHKEGMDIIPSSMMLSGFDMEMAEHQGREVMLSRVMNQLLGEYDYVLIDCPPTLGLLSLNALTASDGIIVPLKAEYLSLEGVSALLETIEAVKENTNQRLSLIGFVITMYNGKHKIQKDIRALMKEHFKNKVFDTAIRNNIALAEAPSFGEDIFTYSEKSTGATDYRKLAKEVLERDVR